MRRRIGALRACAQNLIADRAGVTVLEYAIMASMICAAIVGSVFGYGNSLGNMLTNTFSQIANSM